MNKLILLSILVIAITLISIPKRSVQNNMTENYAKSGHMEEFKSVRMLDLGKSKEDPKSSTEEKVHGGPPRILFLLNKDTGQASWSPSFWWNYQHSNTRQTGC